MSNRRTPSSSLGVESSDLVGRLRFRAALAEVNGQGITAALHREAADEIESLYAKVSEDRQTRWALRARLDKALEGRVND